MSSCQLTIHTVKHSLPSLNLARARAHRIFATVCLFDAVLVFLLWALVSQVRVS